MFVTVKRDEQTQDYKGTVRRDIEESLVVVLDPYYVLQVMDLNSA